MLLLGTTSLSGLSCAPSVDVPPPPDLQPVLDAYENPSANVRGEIMSAFAEAIAETRDEIENSDLFNEILDVIISVQEELDEATDEEGNIEINGVKFPSPNGVIQIAYICTGWDRSLTDPDPDMNGMLELTMTLSGGSIGPIVWGIADECRYLATIDDEDFQASYDGDVAVHFGDFVAPNQPLRELLQITFLVAGTIGFDGGDFRINQSFRVAENGRLDILVQIDDTATFIYFFEGEDLAQGITDATGTFGCSLEERECASESGSFSW